MLRAIRSNRSTILACVIIFCAAIARIIWPGIAEFKYDEAMISRRAIDLAQHGIWPPSTISSIPGIPQPPMKALLLAIPYALTRNPLAAVLFQGVLGTITVALAYHVGARYFDRRAGLIAAAAIAFAPWALFYDRKLWSQAVPLITTLMVLGLFLSIVERKRWGLILSAACLGLLIGFYLGDAILAGVVFLAVALFVRTVVTPKSGENHSTPWLWGGAAIAVLGITLIPYAIELGARGSSPTAVTDAVSENTPRPFDPLGQLVMSAQVASGLDFHALAGDKMPEYYQSLPLPNLNLAVDGPLVACLVASMLYIAIRAIVEALRAQRAGISGFERVRKIAPYALLGLWLFVPVIAWTLFRQQPYPHRYIMALPSQAIALGIAASDGWRWLAARQPKWAVAAPAIVTVALVAISIWHGVQWFGMLRFVETTPINGGHGAPAERLWSAVEEVHALSPDSSTPVVVHTSGDDPEYQGGAAEFDAVLGDRPLYLIRTSGIEVIPQRDFIWLRDHGNGRYTVEKRPGQPASTMAGLARQANGIDLLSAAPAISSSDNSETITLTWRVWHEAAPGKDYGFTGQLYGPDGAALGQIDTPFLRGVYWRTGDTITTTVDIPIKDGIQTGGLYTLVVAMYAYLSETQIEPVDILDSAGNPAGQMVTIELK